MNTTYVAFIIALLVLVAGALWYTRTPQEAAPVSLDSSDMGTYAYTCDKDVAFMMTPSSDMATITISPVADMAYPAKSVLADSPTDTGRRFRNADFEFHGRGEAVTLYDVQAATTYTCAPQSRPDEAPFNFGD